MCNWSAITASTKIIHIPNAPFSQMAGQNVVFPGNKRYITANNLILKKASMHNALVVVVIQRTSHCSGNNAVQTQIYLSSPNNILP